MIHIKAMSHSQKEHKATAAIHFGSATLKRATAKATKIHGKRGLSRYVRILVESDLNSK
jgi:hypothetical protein